MSIADELRASLQEQAPSGAKLLRMLAATASHAERVKLVTEAYDSGKLPIDTYVAVVGMSRANVRPETPELFVALVEEALVAVPSRTVVAIESYWKAKVHPSPQPNFDSLFEEMRRRLDSSE